MKQFDPDWERQQLLGPVGIAYYREKSLENAASKRALTVVSDGILCEAIRCVLVGFNDDARELLRKSKEWLEYVIGAQERSRDYFHGGTEASRHSNLALCNWLLSDCHDRENLDASTRWREVYFNEDRHPIKADVAPTLPVYIDANKYELAIARFEWLWDRKRPKDVERIRGEAAMCYVMAAAKLRHEYSEDQVRRALSNFLNHQVSELLEHGGYTYLARWLKNAFWNHSPDRQSAFETVRKCYDYLPNVARP